MFLFPVQAFGTVTYYFYESTSDCGSGDFFNEHMKMSAPASLDTILVVVPGTGDATTSIFRTIANAPNNGDWETGGFTVKLKVVDYIETPNVIVKIGRENSSCANQEYATASSQILIDSTGVYTFTIDSKDWAAGAAGDRMAVQFNFVNGLFQDPDSVWIEVGTINSSVESGVADWYGYVNVQDTVQGEDIWDAMIFGEESCDGELEGEDCRKYNHGGKTWAAAGNWTYGKTRTLIRDASGKAIANLDSAHFGIYVHDVHDDNSRNLVIYAVSDSLSPWIEGKEYAEQNAYPRDSCGVTWIHTQLDSNDLGSCDEEWEEAGGTYRTAIACTIAVTSAGQWYWATDFIRLMNYIDTAISYEYWDVAGGYIIKVDNEETENTIKKWRSSEYTDDVTLRPMIIRYGKVREFYHAKITPETGQTDTLIVGTDEIDSWINVRRWHYYDDSTYFKIDLNRVSALFTNKSDNLQRLTTQDTLVAHEFVDQGDSILEWFIVLTDAPKSENDTSFTYPFESFNLTLADQTLDTTHSVLDTFGYTVIGGSNHALVKDIKQGTKYLISTTGIIDTVVFYGKTGNGAQAPYEVKACIYSDNAGAPDSLLATSGAIAVTSDLAWRKATFSSEVFLDSGSYWLTIISATKFTTYYDAGTQSQRAVITDVYSDGPSDPFGSPSYTHDSLSIYAIFRPWSELDTMVQLWGLDTVQYFNLFDSNGAYGSWTAIHKSRAHNEGTIVGVDTTWEKFFTGIAFQVNRPYIFKWYGGERINKLECWLKVDTVAGEITIYVPKSYLDTCTYPVVIDPWFGFQTLGKIGSLGNGRGYSHQAIDPWKHIAGANETIDTVCWYGKRISSNGTVKIAVYDAFTGTPNYCANNRIYLSDAQTTYETPYWIKVAVSIPMTEGLTYVMAYGDAAGGGARHSYSWIPGSCHRADGLLDPLAATSINLKWIGAAYAVYTIGGEPPAAPLGRRRKIILINE